MTKYGIMSTEEKKQIAKKAIERLSKLANSYRQAGFENDANNYEREKQEFIEDFPELA